MKSIFTICTLLLSLGVFAQEAGKLGELLKNEAKVTEMQTPNNNRFENKNRSNSTKNTKNKRQPPRSNEDYRWNYSRGNSEVFLRIPEEGRFTVEIEDQIVSNTTGKFRFFELQAGSTLISIYEGQFLIYRTRLMVRVDSRTVLDFFSDYGLYLLGTFPQQNQSYGINQWDDIWNNPYNNLQDYGSGNQDYYSNVMNNQEFNQLMVALKRDASFDDTKIGMVSNVAKHTSFKTVQIYDLIKSLSYEKGKVELAKLLYSKCVDQQNFYQVYEAFSFDSSKRELNAFIAKN